MPPRRTHTKSRNGCGKCKKRRVKCDEVHPACGNCIKHAIECDFSSLKAPGSDLDISSPGSASPAPSSAIESSSSTLRRESASPPLHGQDLTITLLPRFQFQQQQRLVLPPVGSFGWTMRDMELMHHFTLYAPAFLAANEVVLYLWRDTIPKLAFGDEYGCIMHGMLAVSSLHLAFLEPENRAERLINAAAHYDQTVRTITAMISTICESNYEAVFISSILIVVFATASPMLPGHAAAADEPWTLPEWIPLIRGVHSILKEVSSWVETGCLGPLLKVQFHDNADKLPGSITKALKNLYALCTDTSEPQPEEIKDTQTSSTYFSAIHELQKSFANVGDVDCSTVSLAFRWPICVSDKYVCLLKERRPRALIIFAHYCALLKRAELHWWVNGRAEYELVRIERSIHEPEKWNKWLEWPRQMVRGEGQT